MIHERIIDNQAAKMVSQGGWARLQLGTGSKLWKFRHGSTGTVEIVVGIEPISRGNVHIWSL